MGKFINLTGQKFGKWIILKRARNNKWNRIMWFCKCECGKFRVVSGQSLVRGNSKSCGCLKSQKTKERMSNCNNINWKGDQASLDAIHQWIKRRKPKSDICECCGINAPCDLANISQEYHRNINDFEWLCRKCHMLKDGRMRNLINHNRNRTHFKKISCQ